MANPIKFHLVQSDEQGSLTALINGKPYVAGNTHASWPQLVAAVTTADENSDLDRIAGLFDPSVGVQTYFDKVSERVSIAGGHVYFDGEEINDGLTDAIIRFTSENDEDRAMGLVNFLENIMTNPNDHSRTQLYDWLSRRDFTITPDGCFIAYKGVQVRSEDKDDLDLYPYESISSGTATVDGKVYKGRIPNGLGAVVEMPRGDVAHDPNVACHTGLHAGNWRYASNFGRVVLEVLINPRDVVSVPHDSSSEKIRCCRYTVLRVAQGEITESYLDSEDLDMDYSDDLL